MDILKTVRKEGEKQKITLGIHRSDYMVHSVEGKEKTLKQVELNTIAASFSNLSSLVSEMHRLVDF